MRRIESPTNRQDIWNLLSLGRWGQRDFPKTFACPSGQANASEKILKALIRAVTVKNRVNGQVSNPNSVICIGGLQPFECVLILICRCVDLSQSVRRNVTFPRNRFQLVCDSECVASPSCSCKGYGELRCIERAVA